MSTMSVWAEEEVEKACKRENPDWDGESFDYGCSCYQSALKAYKSLSEDGHSGFSFAVTRNILNRLMNDLPLTPIEDIPENWNEIGTNEWQCNRMYGLFKEIKDGKTIYKDHNRVRFLTPCEEKDTYNSGSFYLADQIVNEKFPIEFPYYPSITPYKVFGKEYLVKGYEGDDEDFNTILFDYITTPSGEYFPIGRYFAEKGNEFVEITYKEFNERLRNVNRS